MNSIWTKNVQIEEREPLNGDIKAEIAVIGAGIAGLLIASELQRAGHQVVILEAKRIASGQTQNTTAKITSQHGMIYRRLISTLSRDRAKQYAMANEAAIEAYRRLVEKENIDCSFETRNAYVYGDDGQQLQAEAEAAASLGLPASYVRQTALPFSTAGAVCFANQAQFHPMQFLAHIAQPLTVYENTPVLSVKDDLIETTRGWVRAEHIVFACHFPFVNFPGMYFARMHQERSYVLALENAGQVDGMWIGAGVGGYSFRNYGKLLLLGGGGHHCGENSTGGRYALLRQAAREWFPDSREIAHWSAQDCVTADGVPYIGRYAQSRQNWYVATGFQKWGMTSAMVSAMLLRDLICGVKNHFAEVFDPGRFDVAMVSGVAAQGGQAVRGLAKELFQIPEAQAAEILNGHGGIVVLRGEKVGVYKDEDGHIYPVNTRCPHMGCQLEWNPDERSWDCPCHGSRFDGKGSLISGPAQENLAHAGSQNSNGE